MNFCNLLLLTLFVSVGKSQSPLPVVTIQSPNDFVAQGTSTTFTCITAGATSSITWKHNNRDILAGTNFRISPGNLTVINFSPDLEGNYTCIASNAVGISSSSTAVVHLAVQQVEFFSTDPQSPRIVRVTEGQSTSVNCGQFTSTTPVMLDWKIKFGNRFEPLSPHDRAYGGLNSSLFLLQPRNATYSCTLTNSIEPRSDLTGYIQIIVERSTASSSTLNFLAHPQDISTKRGTTVTFECIPGGGGSVTQRVGWTHPSITSTHFRTSPFGLDFRFTISAATTEFAGSYSCTFGETVQTSMARLTIIEPPSITSGLSPLSLTYGDPLLLSCSASSTHPVHWEWFHNGSRLLDELGPTLRVANAVIRDAGSYQCMAYNSAGYVQSAATVRVNTIAASITRQLPSSQLAFRGMPFSMGCSGLGAPPPTYRWFKADTPLETGSVFDVGTPGTLLIRNVEGSSEGSYRCQVRNSLPDGSTVGSDETVTILTTIVATVVTRELGVMFSVQVDTELAVLPCEATHHAGASITYSWTKDGSPLVLDNEHIRFTNRNTSGNLTIDRVGHNDSGVYQCVVETTSEGGLRAPTVRSTSTNLRVTELPVAPVITALNSSSPSSIRIQWIFTGTQSMLSNYAIEVELLPSSWTRLSSSSINAVTSLEISNQDLMAFTYYSVRVVAIYTDGRQALSEPGRVRTGTGIPNSPTNVGGSAPTDTSLNITWNAPSLPRGMIINYVVMYRLASNPQNMFDTVSTNSGNTFIIISNLPKSQKFLIKVAAETSAGRGLFSPTSEAVTSVSGILIEPNVIFSESIGFIILMVVIVLVLLVCVVMVSIFIIRKTRRGKNKTAGRYHVRNSAYFGKGMAVVGTEATDTNLTEDAMTSYRSRHNRAFSSASPTGSKPETDIMVMEGESSIGGGTDYTYTSGFTYGSDGRLIQAPSYIDPPSFEETVKSRSRSHSAASAYNQGRAFENPVANDHNWDDEQESSTPVPSDRGAFSPTNNIVNEYNYEDSDNSIEKKTVESYSEDTDPDCSQYTQYSHLAPKEPTTPVSNIAMPMMSPNHHQINLPVSPRERNQTLSPHFLGGRPMSIGGLVHARLKSPSPENEIDLNCATYV